MKIMDQLLDKKLATLFRASKIPQRNQLRAMRSLARGSCDDAPVQYGGTDSPMPDHLSTLGVQTSTAIANEFLCGYGLCSARDADQDGCSGLMYAAMGGQAGAVDALCSIGADVRARMHRNSSLHLWFGKGCTALHWAALAPEEHAAATVAALLAQRASMTSREYIHGNEPLHMAANTGCVAAIEALLSSGAFIDARNHAGVTPFLDAARSGNLEAAECLLAHHADPAARSIFDNTALSLVAIYSGSAELAALIVAAGCPVDTPCTSFLAATRRMTSRTHRAAFTLLAWSLKIASLKGSRSFWVYFFNNCEGLTPLMGAAVLGNRDVAQVLLAAGADASTRSCNDFNAADWAQHCQQPDDFVQELRAAATERGQWLTI